MSRGESGNTILGVSLLLTLPLIVGGALATTIIGAGTFSSGQVDRTAMSAIRRSGSGIELRGTVIAGTDGYSLTNVRFQIGTGPGSFPVNLDPHASRDKTVVSYRDAANYLVDVPYVVNWIVADGDNLLERGELAEIDVDLRNVINVITSGDGFTLEMRPSEGLYVSIRRTLPPGRPLDAIVALE